MPSPDPRDPGIEFYPPHLTRNTDLAEPGMFCSDDGTVINWLGENYYKACGRVVRNLTGGTSTCVKRSGHPGDIHEDFDGMTFESLKIDYSEHTIESAIFDALGMAASCWENTKAAGDFDTERHSAIRKALLRRVQEEMLGRACELCRQPQSKHIIRTEEIKVDGQKAIRTVGWTCPPRNQVKPNG